MNLGIEGKRALVVGGTGNTGLAVVAALAAEGAKVAAVARQTRLAASAQAGARTFAADLLIEDEMNEAIRWAADLGAPDIIVHVIGGSAGVRDSSLPSSEWARVWRLNVGVPHDFNRAFLPGMAARGWGRVVHFSSNGVKLATGNSPYTSAKAAVEAYVRTMARQWCDRGVVISAVAPGPIFTDGPNQPFIYRQSDAWTADFFRSYVPMKRWGRGDEIGRAVAFLCSEVASYMAGAIVPVDGGMR